MSPPRSATLLAYLLLCAASASAADDRIPSSLPKDKQEKLNAFLERVKKGEKGNFIPANSKFASVDPHLQISPADIKGGEVKEYLSAVVLHGAKDSAKGPDKADVYWYRPNPKKGSPGVTVKRVVSLTTGMEVGTTQVLAGYPAPLTREERAQAIDLAKKSKAKAVGALLREGQKDVILEVLFETLTSDGNPNGDRGDRVVTLRIRKKGEKMVAVDVNLTKQSVRVP